MNNPDRPSYCMNTNSVVGNDFSDLHQHIVFHTFLLRTLIHARTQVCFWVACLPLRSFLQSFWFRQRCSLLSWNSNADAHEIAPTAVKWSTINREKKLFSKEKQKKNKISKAFQHWAPLVFFSRWITHIKCFPILNPEVAWSHGVCCLYIKVKLPPPIYVLMCQKVWKIRCASLHMIKKFINIIEIAVTFLCGMFLQSMSMGHIPSRGGPDYAA